MKQIIKEALIQYSITLWSVILFLVPMKIMGTPQESMDKVYMILFVLFLIHNIHENNEKTLTKWIDAKWQ